MNDKILTLLVECLKTDTKEKKDNKEQSTLFDNDIGKYVIVRTRNEGLNCGYLQRADETGCILTQARRIHTPRSKDTDLSWYEGIAVSGLHEQGRISGKVEQKIIIEDYSITSCSKVAKDSLEQFEANKTTCV